MILKSIRSFKYAFRGLRLVFKNENNAKIHLLATVTVIIAGAYLRLEKKDWLWLLLSISLVWIAEAFNSAIEKLVDLVSPEFNIKAGNIKDISAAAVLLTAIFAIVVGAIIFIPACIHKGE